MTLALLSCLFFLLVGSFGGSHGLKMRSMPGRTMGAYILLADDSHANYTTTTDYQPQLYPYQTKGFNVFWFTFLNPQTMTVPKSFENLANCRGQSGCPTNDQLIIFSIGGQVYSDTAWPWLQSEQAATAMAQQVALWFTKYNIDGIDIDIEGNAGSSNDAANNAIAFVNALKQALTNMKNNGTFAARNNLITLPVYGYPQINAENMLVNNGFDSSNGQCYGKIDSIGIMVYDDLESLEWVKDYANATDEYQGFPITCDVPTQDIIAGIEGTASTDIINQMAQNIVSQNLGGIMVWYASVYDATKDKKGLQYQNGASDASTMINQTGNAWFQALNTMNG